jgi:predicted regulator of Ras-like GTPase activity (Roadblock/LC7/MglB family)
MFKETLLRCVEATEGAMAGVLMGLEGISLASYQRDDAECDIEVVGAEASVIIKSLQRTGQMLDAGRMLANG